MKKHFTAPYLLDPLHPVTINVIGAGGNGSQMLNHLARLDYALKKLGHIGLHITCYDDDIVTEANMGRQLFSPADIGLNKAVVLITRLNRFFGTSYNGYPVRFIKKVTEGNAAANITVTCVDSLESRAEIRETLLSLPVKKNDPYLTPLYWMDLGNAQFVGQVVLGTVRPIEQPKISTGIESMAVLPDFFDKFPIRKSRKKKPDNGPSCSLAEALEKQDLFINSTLTQFAAALLWKMFREGSIEYHGVFLNLQTFKTQPINL